MYMQSHACLIIAKFWELLWLEAVVTWGGVSIRTLSEYIGSQLLMFTLQFSPVKPGAKAQVYPPTPSLLHVAPFMQCTQCWHLQNIV